MKLTHASPSLVLTTISRAHLHVHAIFSYYLCHWVCKSTSLSSFTTEYSDEVHRHNLTLCGDIKIRKAFSPCLTYLLSLFLSSTVFNLAPFSPSISPLTYQGLCWRNTGSCCSVWAPSWHVPSSMGIRSASASPNHCLNRCVCNSLW